MKKIRPVALSRLEAEERHAEAFAALGHASRLQVFFLLVRARGEVAVGEIAEATGIPGPTLNHHVDRLKRVGLVSTRRDGRYVLCAARRELVNELVRLLTACC